jgi:raffinose/stachyose/melibiose transport system permease protein
MSRSASAVRRRVVRVAAQLLLLAVAIVWTYPLTGAILSSVKSNREVLGGSLGLLPEGFRWELLLPGGWGELGKVFHLENYAHAWFVGSFGQYFGNSVMLTVSTVIIVVTLSCLSGYVLGRYSFAGKKVLIGVFAVSAFLPEGYTIIPIWQLIKALGLSESMAGLILAVSSGGHLLYILLFSAYFAKLPHELEEAAVMDGAGFLRIFATIMVPLAKPALATVTILETIRAWNDFFMPLVFTANRPDLQTIAVGLYTQFTNRNTADLATMAAGIVIAFIPVVVVFIALQKYFVEGIAGAVKS